MKAKLFTIIFVFATIIANAQSLTYNDIINIQKSNLEKVNGFFSQAGWTWISAKKDNVDWHSDDYILICDKTEWKNRSNEYAHLFQKEGCVNIFVYFTSNTNFNEIENYVKAIYSSYKSGVENNRIWTSYRGQNNLEIMFNTKKSKDYNSQTWYEIDIYNYNDIDKRIAILCSNCKGTGQIVEYIKCRNCNGSGKEFCRDCSGKGLIICSRCDKGYTLCNKCRGKGMYQCNKCGGRGTYQCNKCNGKGEYQCYKCSGRGTLQCYKCSGRGEITQTKNGQTYKSTCPNCDGNGKITCVNCSGIGKFTCINCDGKGRIKCENCAGVGTLSCTACSETGKILCQYCGGNYSNTCAKCNGTGQTDIVCSYCNGTGNSSEKMTKVCPVCNGSKLKQQ